MFPLLKRIEGRFADPLGGRIGIVKLRIGFFEILEFAKELVVVRV